MKNRNPIHWLPVTAVSFALAGFCLRWALYNAALDLKNLLEANHPLELALWAAMAVGAALLLIGAWTQKGPGDYESSFSASTASAVGHILMGVCLLLTVLTRACPTTGTLALLWKVFGFFSAPAMVWGGICRRQGRKPFFGVHVLPCLFLLVHMVCQYQTWSGNPQLQDYVFELLAAVAMALFCYQCAAFEAGTASRRMQLATGLLTVLLSGPALHRAQFPLLYLGGALWAATSLCSLTSPKKGGVDAHDPS